MFKKNILIILSIFIWLLSACGTTNEKQTTTNTPPHPTDTSTPSPPTATPGITPSPFPNPVLNGNVWFYGSYGMDGWGWPTNAEIELSAVSQEGTQKFTFFVVSDGEGNIPMTSLEPGLEDGDQITISLADKQLQIPYTDFSAIADVFNSKVEGLAQPFSRMLLTLEHPKDNWINIETVADQDGRYLFDVPVDLGWEINDNLLIGQFVQQNVVINLTMAESIHYIDPLVINNEKYEVLTFSSPPDIIPGNSATTLIDFDTDGDLDLVMQVDNGPIPGTLLAFRNNGKGIFIDVTADVFGMLASGFEKPRHWAVADFNGDGKDDLFFAMQGIEPCDPCLNESNRIYIQNDFGQLVDESETRIPQEIAFSHNTSTGDIDNDGDIDIYVGNWTGQTPIGPRFYINDGTGFFTDDISGLPSRISTNAGGDSYSSCQLVDVDNDGDLDLVLGFPAPHGGPIQTNDTLLLNDGKGQFAYAPENSLPQRMNGGEVEEVGISSADFNNDGWMDLIISVQHVYGIEPNRIWTDPKLQLLYNNGDGTFRDETTIIDRDWEVYAQQYGVNDGYQIDWSLIFDYNNDGWLDIVVVGYNISPILLENVGGIEFIVTENFGQYRINYFDGYPIFREWDGAQKFPSFVVPGDLDGDGDLDFILLFEGDTQMVLLTK